MNGRGTLSPDDFLAVLERLGCMADPLDEEKVTILGQTCTPWYDPAFQHTSFIPDFSDVTDVDELLMEESVIVGSTNISQDLTIAFSNHT